MNTITHPEHRLLFANFPVLSTVKISIVIPVKDEEDHILKSLAAFQKQKDVEGNLLHLDLFEILLLANNCSDSSVDLIKNFKKENPDLNIYLEEISFFDLHANIGYVRRLLMETAYNRLQKNAGGIILTTDSDSTVSQDWIAQNNWEIESGADAVGGRILLFENELSDLDEFTLHHHFKDEKYLLLIAELEYLILQNNSDPSPRHHQHFNGSFAITTECYEKSGGVPDVTHLEDCALFESLQSIDAKVRHSHKVVVQTSARYIGRTEVGLSYQLNKWKNSANNGDPIFVESCESIVFKLNLKKKLQDLWKTRSNEDLNIESELLDIDHELTINQEVILNFKNSIYFGEWFAQIMDANENYIRGKFDCESIDSAILNLEKYISEFPAYSFSQTSIR